jgi:hypothetical protein
VLEHFDLEIDITFRGCVLKRKVGLAFRLDAVDFR